MAERNRYSDQELKEFRSLIEGKLEKAKKNYELLIRSINNSEGNGTEDTAPTFKPLEEGSITLSREENNYLAVREMVFIQHLLAAILRIENKTYGICRETGRLIPKERLMAVPHATLCIEAKNLNRKK